MLLDLVNATPAVRAEALPFLRTMFLFSIGMLMFFMLGGALRAAGDARTPLRLGIAMTVLNLVLNVVLIRGAGPIPAFGTQRRGDGHGHREHLRVGGRAVAAPGRQLVVHFRADDVAAARLGDHPLAVSVRPAGRHSGRRDERRAA